MRINKISLMHGSAYIQMRGTEAGELPARMTVLH
jgi:hypothetical protein